ncbi:MAG: hypothetical protein AAF901_14220, partial [Bacteroidota bacterium]
QWHKNLSIEDTELTQESCRLIAKSLCINSEVNTQNDLVAEVNLALQDFQSQINTISDQNAPALSLAAEPIKFLTEKILDLPQFSNKIIFLLLDEYENYTDYQQQLINTHIKHSTENFTFKVGVRELGWRVKHTLNPDELLHDPADYVLFNLEYKLVTESRFSDFAKSVCQQRIQQVLSNESIAQSYNIESAFGSLTVEEEAEILGVEKTDYYKEILGSSSQLSKAIKNLPKLYLFFIAYWARWHEMTTDEAIYDYSKNKKTWDTRYENYKYNTLFKIRKGRGMRGVQKHYSGWNTYVKLANGNIRYLMELVYRAFEKHIEDSDHLHGDISHKNQTLAAQDVGLKNLSQLEGLKRNGAQLTKLLLGLGRVFQILASSEGNIAPEINQFTMDNSESINYDCKDLIDGAVMNLALVRSPGNKLNDDTHTRDYNYSIHPIFTAFFVFSYRKKRKIVLRQKDILGFVNTPKVTIRNVLQRSNVPDRSENEQLPTQMNLFERFYND